MDLDDFGLAPTERGVTPLQIVPYLVGLYRLVVQGVVDRAARQLGQTPMTRYRTLAAGMGSQQTQRPQLMRVAAVLGKAWRRPRRSAKLPPPPVMSGGRSQRGRSLIVPSGGRTV
jgi:hypothetical protein